MINELFQIIETRKMEPKVGSYTNQLLSAGEDEILKKIGEEAIEVILAAKSQGNQRLVEEMADLTYHSLVLLSLRGLRPEDIEMELNRRHQAAMADNRAG